MGKSDKTAIAAVVGNELAAAVRWSMLMAGRTVADRFLKNLPFARPRGLRIVALRRGSVIGTFG